jgi:hypothetical protein
MQLANTTAIVHSYDLVRLTTVDYAVGTSGCTVIIIIYLALILLAAPPLDTPPLHTQQKKQ